MVLVTAASLPLARSVPALQGVLGEDNRQILAADHPAAEAVGRLNFAGYKTKRLCTGTLVAPDAVITAAQCLIDRRAGSIFSTNSRRLIWGGCRETAKSLRNRTGNLI